ncbi:MAG TPA: transglutaminase-like domain-containing protein, partial [Pirellulaceae bacterium]|nr:transglutaminase-like domain-containing protein [Pirellulaceae bacterium]
MTAIPKPRRRLWRTWLKWPRDLRQFAPRIDARDLLAAPPAEQELAHWGEVILLEDIVIALHRDGTTSWLTHLVTMPYSNELLSKWDDVNRTYDERTTRLSLRRAVVYSPSAGMRKATKQVAPLSPYERLQKLTFAPLHPGVTIEMEMQDDSFIAETPGPSIWANFALITAPPCRRRRLTAAIADPFTATVQQHFGGEPPLETQQGDYRVYQWELFDAPGIEFDAFTPPPHDFIPWIDISSLPDWEPIARHYRRELLPPRPTPGPVAQLARELTAAATTPHQMLEAIYAYAARDVRYGRHPSELSTPKIRDASKMLEDLRGDCKDKSSLMVAMLREVGIPAEVVVVLTGQNGRTPF